MPLLSGPRACIELPVSDRRVGDTIIKQKARFLGLRHEQQADGTSSATITVIVTLYAAESGGFGPRLTGPGFAEYAAELVADNRTAVNAQTGAILAVQGENSASEWQAKLEAFPQPVMLQGDFFEYLREQQPVLIGAMIRQHIQQADAFGRFA